LAPSFLVGEGRGGGPRITDDIQDDQLAPSDPPRPGLWSRELPVDAIIPWLSAHGVGVAIAAGIVFRVAQYLANRAYWMDEGALIENVRRLSPGGFFGPLGNSQLAPPGFLLAEWAAFRALGDRAMAFRLVPLLGGIASLFLIREAARRCLPDRAVWLAVALFAVANDPIYFSSEAKQYSTDVTAALACTLLALTLGARPSTATNSAILAGSGAAIVWCSHPSIFVLAAAGVVALSRAIAARDVRSAGLWAGIGLAWVASFAAVHLVAMEQLGHRPAMWAFWEFAFPPIPPRSFWDASWPFRRVAFLFLNPLNFDAPFGPRLSMLPALGLAFLGFARLWKVDSGRLALLILPGAFAFLASCLRLYPFHGRLLLFLAPAILLVVAAGLDRVREAVWLYRASLAMVLLVPGATACYHLVEPRDRSDTNYVGDLRSSGRDPIRFPF